MKTLENVINSCIDCKKCWDVCPINLVLSDNQYTPQRKIESFLKLLTDKDLTEDEIRNIYLSTCCGLCDDVCPVNIPITKFIQYGREILAKQGKEPEKTKLICSNIIHKNSPGAKNPAQRFLWITPDLEFSDKSDIGYMAGCWVAYSHPEIAQSTIRIMNKAGIKPKVLEKEKCCGIFLIDNGHIDAIKNHAEKYMQYIESLGIKKLIVSCPGCYHSIENIYGELCRQPKFKVEIAFELFDQLIETNKIKTKCLEKSVAIIDACAAREKKDIPRKILKSIGVKPLELFGNKTTCCGGPAGLKPNFPDVSGNIAMAAVNRYKEIADTLVSYCPFCLHHTESVCQERDVKINMCDIAVLVEESLLS